MARCWPGSKVSRQTDRRECWWRVSALGGGKCGVGYPQGSIYGLTLFLVYVNYLLNEFDFQGRFYAHVKLFRKVMCPEDKEKLQNDFYKLVERSDKWVPEFNKEKYKVMNIGKKQMCRKHIMKNGPCPPRPRKGPSIGFSFAATCFLRYLLNGLIDQDETRAQVVSTCDLIFHNILLYQKSKF